MEYLPWANRAQEGDLGVDDVPIHAGGRKVVIIGGGDTGADCLGTAHRQGAEVVYQFEIMPRPPEDAARGQPVADLALDPTRSPRPTRRAASGCTPSTPRSSWATTTAACVRLRYHEVEPQVVDGRPIVRPGRGLRA